MVGSVGVVFGSSCVFAVNELGITSRITELWRCEVNESASSECPIASCVIGVGLWD
jgi:hypothetical protein